MIVGFVGLGRMGLPMASHLVAAGYEVRGVDVADGARDRARAAGVAIGSFADLARCEVVCSSLPDSPQVVDAYLSTGGILAQVAAGTVCFDLSTIAVDESRRVAAVAAERGVSFLDCPVSGTSIHAEAGTLAVMVGGDPVALERGRVVLERFSSAVHHVGENGAGLRLKLITNRLLTSHLAAIAEAILNMEDAGLDVEDGLELLRAGAVPRLLDYKAAPLAARDFSPQFTIDLMHKDLKLAADILLPTPMGVLAAELVAETAAAGRGDEDVVALISVLEQRLGLEPRD